MTPIILSGTVFLFMVCQCKLVVSSSPHQPEPAEITVLIPRGVVFRINDIPGTTLAAIHYSVNEALPGNQAGQRNHDITSKGGSYNTYWEYRDTLTKVNPGDTINYWVYMIIDGLAYHLLDQSWTAPKAECSCTLPVFTGQCYSNTNQCICKPEYSGTNCTRCADGRFDYPYCIKCYCNYYGTAYSHCKVDRRECVCKPEFDGVKCDRCAPGFYNFKHCFPISSTPPGMLSADPGNARSQTRFTANATPPRKSTRSPTTLVVSSSTRSHVETTLLVSSSTRSPVETTTQLSAQETSSNHILYIVIGALSGVLVMVIIIVTLLVFVKRRRRRKKDDSTGAKRKNAQIIEFDYQHGRSADTLVRAGYAAAVSNNVYMTTRALSDVDIIEHDYRRSQSETQADTDQILTSDANEDRVYLELSHSSYINPVSFG